MVAATDFMKVLLPVFIRAFLQRCPVVRSKSFVIELPLSARQIFSQGTKSQAGWLPNPGVSRGRSKRQF
jgi:hypothetical protein